MDMQELNLNHSKLMILGLGLVGKSLLNMLIGEGLFSIREILVADMDREAFDHFSSLGGTETGFICLDLDSKSYKEIFAHIGKDDYLIRLANGCDDAILVRECLERGIHYICTSDDKFKDLSDSESSCYRADFYQIKELIGRSKGSATSILQFGMNPGLISILTKKALMDIVENDDGDYVEQNRGRLRQLFKEGNFALLAKELQVTAFIESDLDTTKADIEEDKGAVYNTWNVLDFYWEMNDHSIQKLGSLISLEEHLKRLNISPDQIYFYDRHDGTLELDIAGKDLTMKAYSGQGTFSGFLDPHEELFSIYDYYTIRDEKGEIDYAPSVIFVYRPCDLAIGSICRTDRELYLKGKYHDVSITRDRVCSGTEEVGITVEGKNFESVYVYVAPVLEENSVETPTVLEVSASVFAALHYILKHPDEGILFPEYLDVDEILSYTGRSLPVASIKTGEGRKL